jgi:hypothetical protein
MLLGLPVHVRWPPSVLLIAAMLLIGGALLTAAIATRRTYGSANGATAADLLLLMAAVWNAAIVFAFLSPHNRHVFHLATHRASVFINAAVGVVWLSLCVFSVVKWFRPSSVPPETA